MVVPNKYCPLGIEQSLVCRGELCMWFDPKANDCRMCAIPTAASAEETPVEEKPKATRAKKTVSAAQ